jgi:hypothetical protein
LNGLQAKLKTLSNNIVGDNIHTNTRKYNFSISQNIISPVVVTTSLAVSNCTAYLNLTNYITQITAIMKTNIRLFIGILSVVTILSSAAWKPVTKPNISKKAALPLNGRYLVAAFSLLGLIQISKSPVCLNI